MSADDREVKFKSDACILISLNCYTIFLPNILLRYSNIESRVFLSERFTQYGAISLHLIYISERLGMQGANMRHIY